MWIILEDGVEEEAPGEAVDAEEEAEEGGANYRYNSRCTQTNY